MTLSLRYSYYSSPDKLSLIFGLTHMSFDMLIAIMTHLTLISQWLISLLSLIILYSTDIRVQYQHAYTCTDTI